MSERGVFAVDRGVWDHPAFAQEPFTEREAWLWLVSEAAYKAHARRADGKVIELQRGQLCHALRFLASAWQWSKSRVDRYLDRLEKHEMLSRERGTRTPIVTLSNYNDYQRVALPDRDKSGTTAGQERDKLERKENKEIFSETTSLRDTRQRREQVPKQATRKDQVVEILAPVVGPRRAEAIYEHRELMKARLTRHAAELLAKKLAKASDPNAAADAMVANGWRGFEPEWLEKRVKKKGYGDLFREAQEAMASGKPYLDDFVDPFDLSATAQTPTPMEPDIAVQRDGRWVNAYGPRQ